MRARAVVAAIALVLLLPAPAEAWGPRTGRASWFRAPYGTAAAGPALRRAIGPGWRGRRVRVCRPLTGRCITVRLTTTCQCYRGTRRERLVDLSAGSFRRLAPLTRGLVRVTVSRP